MGVGTLGERHTEAAWVYIMSFFISVVHAIGQTVWCSI